MKIAWQSYVNILPQAIRPAVQKYQENLIETRLRINGKVELVTTDGSVWLDQIVNAQDLSYCINVASRYSPWSASTVSKGYITAAGGHRIGICGESVMKDGMMTGIRIPSSVSIRVARDFPGIAQKAAHLDGSMLIIGPPGSGKTTLLRDLIRQKSEKGSTHISVLDERCEIFPYENGIPSFPCGKHTDILTGCTKEQGIPTLLKNMTPQVIAVDEITSEEDCKALMDAAWCGVELICTAHAKERGDLLNRRIYHPLLQTGVFDWLIILRSDRSWYAERTKVC